MRQTVLRSGLAGACLLLLSGIGTARAASSPPPFQSELGTVSRKGPVGTEVLTVLPSPQPRQGLRTPSIQVDPRTSPGRSGRQRRGPGRPTEEAPREPLAVPEMPSPQVEPAPVAALDTTPLATAAPALGPNFEALPDLDSLVPPDTHGAVGPTKIVTVVSSKVRVHERNGNPLSTVSLDDFWGTVDTAPVSGSRVHFDPDPAYGQGRWIWAAVQGDHSASSGLLVGASTNEEPALGYGYLIDLANDVWADYPTVGFNKNWVVVQVNLYLVAGNLFDSTHIYVFDKAELYGGTVPVHDLFFNAGVGGSQAPAATYDYTVEDLYLLQSWSAGAGQLRLYRIWDDLGVLKLDPVGDPTTDPWANSPGPADFAPQLNDAPGCVAACAPNCRIQTNDSRIQNVVYRAGSLWTAHTIFYPDVGPNRSLVQWWQIDPGATVLQRGLVDGQPTGTFYAFPSLAVNGHGDLLLGYSSFHAGEYAGARYSFRNWYDEAHRLREEAHLKDGLSCYYRDPGSGRNRWGDYSATVVDPLDDTTLWTVQEYAEAGGDEWSTWWGAIEPARTLSIANASVTEGDAGPTALTFTIALSEPTTQSVSVQWSTADGSAKTADGDYVGVSSTLVTFNPGEKTQDVTVTVNGDLVHEADETLFVNLASPTNATLADSQAEGTILDDEPSPQISIGDVVLLEGDSGTTAFVFPVTLSYPSTQSVQASWGTGAVTATPGTDYISGSGFVSFLPGETSQTITVLVNGDTDPEGDEYFTVSLTSPSGGSLLKAQASGAIVGDDATIPGVQGLVAISDAVSPGPVGRNRLQWVNPVSGNPTGIRVDWIQSGGPCGSYPTDAPSATAVTLGTPGMPQTWEHPGLTLGSYYCYSVWVEHSPGGYSAVATAMGQPFDNTGAVKWKYHTGATTIPPATVGLDGILAPSNDYLVHSMERGPSGGAWPASWTPINLGSPAQKRSPIVPIAGLNRAYFTTQDGRVHSVDATTGALLWSTQLTPGMAQAAPAGVFSAWGGAGDYILVGTAAAGGNYFYALDPFTGAVIDRFPQAGDGVTDLGRVYSAAAVDYPSGRVYFASFGTVGDPETLWCLKLGPSHDALSLEWKKKEEGATPLGNITGSPVLRGDRLYVGNDAGRVWAVESSTGSPAYSYVTADAGPIDFVWPDRHSGALYFSTANHVWGVVDSTTSLDDKWTVPSVILTGSNPSTVLQWPGQPYLYVGLESLVGQAGLLQIDVTLTDPNSNLIFRPLEAAPVVLGPPSLDIGGGNNLIHMGSEAGILYAVQVPLP